MDSFTDHHAAETSVSKATDGPLPPVKKRKVDVIDVEDVVFCSSASPPSVMSPPPRSRSGTPELQCLDGDNAASPSPVCTPPSPPEEGEGRHEVSGIVNFEFVDGKAMFKLRYKSLVYRHYTNDDWYEAADVPYELRFNWVEAKAFDFDLTAEQIALCLVEER